MDDVGWLSEFIKILPINLIDDKPQCCLTLATIAKDAEGCFEEAVDDLYEIISKLVSTLNQNQCQKLKGILDEVYDPKPNSRNDHCLETKKPLNKVEPKEDYNANQVSFEEKKIDLLASNDIDANMNIE